MTGPVIAIVLVLCAVFIPVAFTGGMAGRMYQQFAITIAVSVVISGAVALTFTPALCASMQVSLCVKFLTDRPVRTGTLYFFDLLNQEFEVIPMT